MNSPNREFDFKYEINRNTLRWSVLDPDIKNFYFSEHLFCEIKILRVLLTMSNKNCNLTNLIKDQLLEIIKNFAQYTHKIKKLVL